MYAPRSRVSLTCLCLGSVVVLCRLGSLLSICSDDTERLTDNVRLCRVLGLVVAPGSSPARTNHTCLRAYEFRRRPLFRMFSRSWQWSLTEGYHDMRNRQKGITCGMKRRYRRASVHRRDRAGGHSKSSVLCFELLAASENGPPPERRSCPGATTQRWRSGSHCCVLSLNLPGLHGQQLQNKT